MQKILGYCGKRVKELLVHDYVLVTNFSQSELILKQQPSHPHLHYFVEQLIEYIFK